MTSTKQHIALMVGTSAGSNHDQSDEVMLTTFHHGDHHTTDAGGTHAHKNKQYSSTSNTGDSEARRILVPGDSLMSREDVPWYPTWMYVVYFSFFFVTPCVLSYVSYLYVDGWQEYIIAMAFGMVFFMTVGWFIGAVFYNLCGMSANYTRKIGHIFFFVMPVVLIGGLDAYAEESTGDAYKYDNIITDVLWAGWQSQLFIFFMTKPMRHCANFICGSTRSKRWSRWCNCCENTMDAFERPEDRPNHLLWLNTQGILYYVSLFALSFWWQELDSGVQVLVPIFVSGLGDGLAEPVGVKFGKNCCGRDCRYQTHGCCTKHDYTRSVPGSLMVLLAGYAGVAVVYNEYTLVQFIVAMIIVPPIGMIVEAKAPHTLDNPFISVIVGSVATALLYLPW